MKIVSCFLLISLFNIALAGKVDMILTEINCDDVVENECLMFLDTEHTKLLLHFNQDLLSEEFTQYQNDKDLNLEVLADVSQWYHTEDIDWHPFYQELQKKVPGYFIFYTYFSDALTLK